MLDKSGLAHLATSAPFNPEPSLLHRTYGYHANTSNQVVMEAFSPGIGDGLNEEAAGIYIPEECRDEGQEKQFQFIYLSAMSTEQWSKNQKIARSHAMKVVRRVEKKRKELQGVKSGGFSCGTKTKTAGKNIEAVIRASSPTSHFEHQQLSGAAFAQLFTNNSTWAMNSAMLSQIPAVQSTISPLATYTGRVTPHMHQLLAHYGNVIWSAFWQPKTASDLSPLAVDWFSMVRSHPALFHASLYAAATHLDLMHSSIFFTGTPEIRMHKLEAIRLINEKLKRGGDIPEAVILAIMSLVREASEFIRGESGNKQEADKESIFKLPLLPIQWQCQFSQLKTEEMHHRGSRAIVQMKGGVRKLRERSVATAISHNSLITAAFNLAKPESDFWEIPELMARATDPTANVPLRPLDPHRGSNLAGLVAYGLTEEALGVMVEMLNVTVLVEAFTDGALLRPDIIALTCRKNHAHHRLLSLPNGVELSEFLGPKTCLYECCRLAALMFATAVLFPMPRSTGIPQRLVAEIKQCIEQTSLETSFGGGASFFIWVLMLTGVAAAGLPERPWFEGRLIDLLTLKGMTRWAEVKAILSSFLWMDSACDPGAYELWDDIAVVIRKA